MPETIDAQFSELAGHARANARLAQAAELRARGTRRTLRHRGGAALLGTAAVATAVGLGATLGTANASPQTTASSTTTASLAAGKTSAPTKVNLGHSGTTLNLTQAQIAALVSLHVIVIVTEPGEPSHQGTGGLTFQATHRLTAAQIAAMKNLGLTPAQIAALAS